MWSHDQCSGRSALPVLYYSELHSGHPLQQSREASDLRDLAEIRATEAGRRAEEVRVIEGVDDLSAQVQREPLREALVLLEGDVPVLLERRAGARVGARRIAEAATQRVRIFPGCDVEPVFQPVLDAARGFRIRAGDQVRAQHEKTEFLQAKGIVLHNDDREAALVRADGRHLPSAQEPVGGPALVQMFLPFTERQLIHAADVQTMRRLDHRRREFGAEVVADQRAGERVRVVREVIHLAEQIVPVAAESVVDVRAPAAADALLEFQHHRIVTREAGAHLVREDVFELREWAQQLAARHGLLLRERAEGRIAEHRVGYLVEQARPLRQEFRVELIDVNSVQIRAAYLEPLATRAYITSRHDGACRQLVLQVGRVLMNISRLAELIDEVDVAARAGEQAARAARRLLHAVREGVGQRAGRARPQPGPVAGDVSRHRGEAPRPHTILVREGVLVRRIKDAVTAAQHHFVAELVGESDAGRELLLRRVALMRRRAVNAGVQQSAFEIQAWRLYGERLVAREADGDVVIALLQALLEFVAQAEVQGQVRSDAEIVLKITRVVVDVEVVRGADSDIPA